MKKENVSFEFILFDRWGMVDDFTLYDAIKEQIYIQQKIHENPEEKTTTYNQ